MSIDDKLRSAVKPLVAEIAPDLYLGNAEEYCTYNYTESPDGFGDNAAHITRYLVQLHWFLPLKRRPHPKKKKLRRALAAVWGFTAPTVTNASDEVGQHYVFEFEAMEGGSDVAELSFSGLDELILSMQEVAEIPDDVQDEMLNAGADVVVRAQQQAAQSMGVQDTGLTISKIKKTKVKVKNGKRVIYIYPQGTRIRGRGENGKPVRIRNAEIAFINEYGTRRQAARPFVLQGNESSAEETTEAQAAVYYRWLESRGL